MVPTQTKNFTVHLAVEFLHKAQQFTGKGLNETLIIALEQLAHTHAYQSLRALRGKINFTIQKDKT